VQVQSEGGIEDGADVDGVIVIIILGELLFQVMSGGLFHLPSEGGDALTRPSLIHGLTCGRGVILLPLEGVAWHGWQDGGGYGWWQWAAVNPRVMSEMSRSEEKSIALITMLEKDVPLEVR
jgi:hypothetical protein